MSTVLPLSKPCSGERKIAFMNGLPARIKKFSCPIADVSLKYDGLAATIYF
jgi:hypothetical protein